METRRPIVVASNVLLSQSGEILLGLRGDCLKWATPGGKVEAETIVDAARREQREETGMELLGQPLCLGYSDGWEVSGVHGQPWHVCIFLLWKTWQGFAQVVEESHIQWRWFPLHQVPPTDKLTFGTRVLLTSLLPNYLQLMASQPSLEEQTLDIEHETIRGPWREDFRPPVA